MKAVNIQFLGKFLLLILVMTLAIASMHLLIGPEHPALQVAGGTVASLLCITLSNRFLKW